MSEITADRAPGVASGRRMQGLARQLVRFCLAGTIVAAAALGSAQVMVGDAQAVVVSRFGDPVRVVTRPGLAWKWPAPLEGTFNVDLRLHTTSSGLQDVGTRDGLRILVQTFVAWRVPRDPDRIRQFIRATGNNPDEAARQLRSFVGSALQVIASNFNLTDLVNTDPSRVQLQSFEDQLRRTAAQQVLAVYGVEIQQVGIERLSLPAETLAATVARMRAERETVAAERTAEGLRAAAAIRSDATRDARIMVARAKAGAAEIEAQARQRAAQIYARSYARDPQLYTLLRSLDTVGSIVGPRTRLILRTDAAPFDVLVRGPAGLSPPPATPPAPTSDTPTKAGPAVSDLSRMRLPGADGAAAQP